MSVLLFCMRFICIKHLFNRYGRSIIAAIPRSQRFRPETPFQGGRKAASNRAKTEEVTLWKTMHLPHHHGEEPQPHGAASGTLLRQHRHLYQTIGGRLPPAGRRHAASAFSGCCVTVRSAWSTSPPMMDMSSPAVLAPPAHPAGQRTADDLAPGRQGGLLPRRRHRAGAAAASR